MRLFLMVLLTVIVTGQGRAQFTFCGDTNLPGSYVRYAVDPRATDPRITGKNASQRAYISTNTPLRNHLVVFFPGTGGVPASFDNFCQNAANLGFHALALTYENDTSLDDFCSSDPNGDCYAQVRTEFLTGLNTTAKTNVTRVNSIEFRLAAFLNYLNTNNLSEGWGQYLVATNMLWSNALAWTNFLLAGHSQGAGYAAFIAKQKTVQRVVTMAGGDFWEFGKQAAPWNFLIPATPLERWFGFTHALDGFPYNAQLPKWEAQGFTRYGSVVNLLVDTPPYGNSHTFASTLEPCTNIFGNIEYHGATVNDPPQVRDSNGVPFYAEVWAHMLTAPLPEEPDGLIADSIADFGSTQGGNGWRYGFWNRSGDPNNSFQVSDFRELATFSNTLFAIPAWTLSNDLQVAIWQTGARPHGLNTNLCCTNRANGPELWPVRRWVSTVSGEVTIQGTLAKWDTAGGDGVTGLLKINGQTVWSAFCSSSEIFGTNFSMTTNLQVGAVVDLLVSPGANADWDGARFSVQILSETNSPITCGMPSLYARSIGSSQAELRWEACTNYAYQVYTSSNLQSWSIATPPLPAPPNGGWMTHAVAATYPQQFFRVRLLGLTNSPIPTAPGVYADLYLTHGGIPRHFRLNVPTSYNPAVPMPVAFILHGHNQTADEFASNQPNLARLANERGVLLVLPDGTANQRGTGWNTYDPSAEFPVDDAAFILGLLDTLDGFLNIDRKRVYAGGFSNGGQMCHYLGARTTNVFAALAMVGSAVAGTRGGDDLLYLDPPTGPMPVLIVNATNDCKRPYWGGINDDGSLQPPAFDAVIHWTNANLCAPGPVVTTNYIVTNHVRRVFADTCAGPYPGFNAFMTNVVIREHYQLTCTPGSEVLFVTLSDGGHKWPEKADNVGFDASEEALNFFLNHCRCEAAASPAAAPSAPGVYERLFCDQNYSRYYRVQIPAAYNPANQTPVVFTMHGGGETVAGFAAQHPALFSKCNTEGVILVLPQALQHPVSRDTLWMNKPFDYVVDDRVFFTNLLGHLDASLNIDRRRVYACGFSGGGSFSHWLALTTTNLLAAIAPVCTQTGWNEPDNSGPIVAPPPALEPIPVLMVRGTNDLKRPYYGGWNEDGVECRSAADDVNYWTAGNGCAPGYLTATSGLVTVFQYPNCAGTTEVILVRIDGMPHIWPDAADGYGYDANVSVIDFLLMHSR